MAIDLTKPLSWKNASHEEQRMLRALQGNILKGHGRPATVNIFFKIDPAKKHQMRAALREIANYHAVSAYQQLIETDTFQATGQSGSPFVSVFLSATGYAALGVPNAAIPPDPSFKAGMKVAALALGDAPVPTWLCARLVPWRRMSTSTTFVARSIPTTTTTATTTSMTAARIVETKVGTDAPR